MARIEANIELGWSPVLALVSTGASEVLQVVGWQGGFGSVPSTGLYVGSTGYVSNITDGVNVKGDAGAASINISAGTTSNNLGSIVFSNSNNVSFGLSGSTITASISGGGGGGGITAINVSAGSTSTNASAFTFNNGGGVTFGLDTGANAGIVTATVATNYQSQGAYLTTADLSQNSSKYVQNWKLTGNTAGTTSSAQGTDLWLAGGNGVTISGSSNTLSFSVATNYQSQGAYLTTADLSQNSSKYVQNWKLTGNTSGTTSSAQGTDFWLAGGNGVTLSGSSNTISVSVATNYQSQGAYLTTADLSQNSSKYVQNWKLTGNTSGTTSSAQGTDFWLAGGNGVTISGSSNTLSFSVATNYQSQGAYLTTAMQSNAATISNINVSAGTTSTNASAFTFSNANGVSFGLGTGASAGVVTATVAAGAASSLTVGAGNSTLSSVSQMVFVNSNGVSFGASTSNNGSITITATVQTNYLTTAALSGDTSKYMQNWKLTGNTSGTTSSAQGTDVWYSGGNGVTISGSSNSLVFSVATSYRASNDAIGTNTAQSNVTWTVNSSGLSLDARGYAGTGTTFNGANISGSITQNSNGLNLSLSVAAPGGGAAVNVSAGTTSNNLQSIVFANSNGVTFGLNTGASSQSITASVASQSNQTIGMYALSNTTASASSQTFDARTISFMGAGAMSVGFNSTSAGGTTSGIVISAPATSLMTGTGMVSISTNGSTISIGAAETPKSYFANIEVINGLTNLSEGGSSNFVMPMNIPYDISFSYVRIPMSLSLGSGTFGTTANTTIGISQSVTYFLNVYSLGTGANSRSLQYVTGTSITNGFNVTGQIGAASNNQTIGQTLTYVQAAGSGTSSFSATYNVNSASINFSTTGLTSFNGLRWFDMPLAASLSGGAYWLGIQRSTTQSTSGTAGMSTLGLTKFNLYVTQVNSNIAAWGVSSNASTDAYYMGLGIWSTNTNGTTSSSMALANISTSASQPFLPVQFIRQA
jgi:hypothetical protein